MPFFRVIRVWDWMLNFFEWRGSFRMAGFVLNEWFCSMQGFEFGCLFWFWMFRWRGSRLILIFFEVGCFEFGQLKFAVLNFGFLIWLFEILQFSSWRTSILVSWFGRLKFCNFQICELQFWFLKKNFAVLFHLFPKLCVTLKRQLPPH